MGKGAERRPTHLVVGRAGKPHGLRGAVIVRPLTDHPKTHFEPGVRHFVEDECGDLVDALVVESVRPHKKGLVVQFEEVVDRFGAERLGRRFLSRPIDEMDALEEGEAFYHELIGAKVVTREGDVVGRVTEVYPLWPKDLMEVRGDGPSILLPYARELVVEHDRPGRRIIVDPPPGLLPGRGDGP